MIIALIVLIVVILIILGIILDLYLGYKVKHKNLPIAKATTGHNDITTFIDGRQLFSTLEKDIQSASNYIHMSFFIFRNDQIGNTYLQILMNKAQSGVTVRLLVDAVGSRKLPKKQIKNLKKAGVHFSFAAKPTFPFFFYHLNRRNHRKITVIDGKIGYFGGFNIGDEYLGRKAELGLWRDYHLRLTGGSVLKLQEQFSDDWSDATEEKIPRDGSNTSVQTGGTELTLLPTYGRQLEQAFIDRINQAKKTLFIGSPYFIPSGPLQKALLNRLEDGVKMTILLPIKKDHPLVKPASYHYLKPLLEKGCRLYHFYQGFYHAKVFIIDNKSCYIGTANFDLRSLFWNDELNGFIDDQTFAQEITNLVNKDIKERSTAVTLEDINNRSLLEKMKTSLSVLFAPFL